MMDAKTRKTDSNRIYSIFTHTFSNYELCPKH
jgi:hypothetical protein